MRMLYKALLSFLLILIGGILTFLSIFSLGPLPLSSDMFPVFYMIFAGGMNILTGIVYLFPVNKWVVLIICAILIISDLIPIVMQIVLGKFLLFPLLLLSILLGIIAIVVSLLANRIKSK